MRSIVFVGFAGLVGLVACGGSGVDGSKTVSSLSNEEYAKLCKYYNDKATELVGKQCDQTTITAMQVNLIPCGPTTTNVLANSACAARVSDVEACVNSMSACVVTGKDTESGQCLIVDNCFPNR